MLDSDTKRRIDTCRDILVGKVPDPKSQVEQITVALIYKFMDDMDLESEELGGQRRFFTGEFERYRWARLVAPGVSGQDMLNTYSEALTRMVENEGLPPLFRSIFRHAYLPYRDPETLRSFLREINGFTYDHSERLGDAFEYLLSVLGSQGDAGQFRTPRHIIDFMVEIIDPKKTEVILDPACGTAGFLISAYKHILKANSTGVVNGNSVTEAADAAERALESPLRFPGDQLTPEDRARLARDIKGYDISPDMVRLSLVNLYLHGFVDPKVEEYDTLTSEDKWTETADIILANPPFMSPKGGIRPHNRFQVPSKRSEVLFVDYIAEHLNPNGRAAIVVPEGIIFQSQNTYVALRKMLVDKFLAAVISLPAGVFNPYSGVKTSILILDRAAARASDHIAFFKVENDGFQLGAQRKAQKGSQLPQVKAELAAWLDEARRGGGKDLKTTVGFGVSKAEITGGSDYSLTAEKYRRGPARESSYPIARLGDVASIRMGETLIKGDLTGEGRPIFSADSSGEPWAYSSNTKLRFGVNSIVIGARGTIGSVKFPQLPEFTATQTTIVTTANEALIDPAYLYRVLQAFDFSTITEGVGIPMITVKNVGSIPVPVPPLEVQRDLVAEIDGYQRVIVGARAVVENYRPQIIPDPRWPSVPLGDLVTAKSGNGKIIKGTLPSSYSEGLYPAFSATGQDVFCSTYEYDGPGIVVSAVGARCGKCFLADGKWQPIANTHAIIVDENLALTEYLYVFLNDESFWVKGGSAQPFVKVKASLEIPIPLPPLRVQRVLVDNIRAEKASVDGNRDLIIRFENKIAAAMSRVWGEAGTEAAAA